MKQVVQSFKTGELVVTEVPSPSIRSGGILVRTGASLVSAGTERMVVDFAEKNLVAKARARPDLARQVVDKAQREGIFPTIESVRNRLGQPMALGYSSAGVVVEVGNNAGAFKVGDRVACAGGGFASHAELVYIPRNLAVQLPENISYETGAFATLGAIALQGIRQADVQLGHNVAVIGLGLVGQLTVQLLKAAGCRVVGIDINSGRVELARKLGADAATTNDLAQSAVETITRGRGVDAVLITADTPRNDPVVRAGEIARDRGIVVAVGAVGMEIPRKAYYEKELDFRLSRSYGPGRYDASYEEQGHDYPYGYVRWTEQRNIEAFLQLAASGKVDVEPLISHRFAIDEAARAYDVITGKTTAPFLGVLLTYNMDRQLPGRVEFSATKVSQSKQRASQAGISLGLVGAGNYVNATLLPAIKGIDNLNLVGIVSGSGMTAQAAGEKFGFRYGASDIQHLLDDPEIDWLAVATRHNLHAPQTIAAMQAGKSVFVEKPMALNRSELVEVARVQHDTRQEVMVGFNRRFAPMIQEMRSFWGNVHRPMIAICRVNAGFIPSDHWTQDPQVGGGRVVGEACHFVDLLSYLIASPPSTVHAHAVQTSHGALSDEVVLTLTFQNGSVGSIVYTGGGDKAFGKERIEIFGDGNVSVLDDYRSLEMISNGRKTRQRERLRPDKGHRREWLALIETVRAGDPSPVPFTEAITTHVATFAAVESLRSGSLQTVDVSGFWDEVGTR